MAEVARTIRPVHEPAGNRRRDRLPHRRLVIMASLVGRVDAAKSLLQGKFGQMLRLFLFPGGSVKEAGHLNIVDRYKEVKHRNLPLISLIGQHPSVDEIRPGWQLTRAIAIQYQ